MKAKPLCLWVLILLSFSTDFSRFLEILFSDMTSSWGSGGYAICMDQVSFPYSRPRIQAHSGWLCFPQNLWINPAPPSWMSQPSQPRASVLSHRGSLYWTGLKPDGAFEGVPTEHWREHCVCVGRGGRSYSGARQKLATFPKYGSKREREKGDCLLRRRGGQLKQAAQAAGCLVLLK